MGKEEAEANQAAAVRHLDGSTVEYRIPRGSDGEVLFTLVSTRLSIEEKDHFSLCFFDSEGVRHWLYNDKKIIRQLKGLPWQFSFEVKFYPTAPSTLSDDNARHNLFLQVQQEVNTVRIGVTLPTRALLSSFVAQSEFGDATASAEYETYLRSPHLADNNSDLVEKIREFHMQQKGMTESEAESKYLDVCKDLATYGVFMFPAKDAKDVPVKIGVCAQGINIYRHQIRAHRFSWQNVIKISYRRHYFAIKLKAGEIDKKETTLNFNLPSYEAAKRVWKCGVEHHTFFRLIQPEKKPKGSMFRLGSTPFRFQGRTQFQTKMASQMFDQHANTVRSPDSARHVRSLENMDEAGWTQSAIGVRSNGFSSPETMRSPEKTYMISEGSEKRRHHPEQGRDDGGKKWKKQKKEKGKKGAPAEEESSSSSDSSDDVKHEVVVHQIQESGEPHTTVASRNETSELPDQVVVEKDEEGNLITRTVKTKHVKHTVQKHTVQNYSVGDNEQPHAVDRLEHCHSELIPTQMTGISPSNLVSTESRSVEYSADRFGQSDENAPGEFVSSKTVTSGNRTVETITYKVEREGVMETHVEHRVTIHSDADIDHDAELSAAILEATQMNPDMTVEKIEVRQETSS